MSQQGHWQVAGTAAEVYERELVPAVFAPWAPIVVDLAQPRKGDCVLDVACGTGIVARTVADRVGPNGRVVGVDLNPGMLKVARAAWSTGSYSGTPAEWHEASADKLPFPDASFNIAYCQLGLQFFADRSAALREMRRVLAADGRLGLMVWRGIEETPGFAVLAEALERHVGQVAATIMRAPFALSNRDELVGLVHNAGFQEIVIQQRVGTVQFASAERFVLSYVAGSPLASQVSQANDAARTALITDARNALRKYATNAELAFPIAAHLLRGRV